MTTHLVTVERLATAFYIEHMTDLELATFQVLNKLDIDNQEGQTLKNIADLVGAQFFSDDLDLTRAFIKGTAAVNNSSGKWQDIETAWKLLTNENGYSRELFPASMELFTDIDLDSNVASIMLDLMRQATAAGVSIESIIYITDSAVYDTEVHSTGTIYDTVSHTTGKKYAKILAS